MKTAPIAAALLAFAAGAAASEPEPLVWNCAQPGQPSYQQTARVFGIDNFTRVDATRASLMHQIHRTCERRHNPEELILMGQEFGQVQAKPVADRALAVH
ncbi:MAG: hypothetical protein GXC76_02155 [Rhodanobacteraceae bacterium]|jgi:hypothetical protein|nr:hypothetical protein [Rhodanobacteraceae bacterium]